MAGLSAALHESQAMNFISICSGIEAASVAFGPLGWKAIAFSEIEPFPCAVLAHHYPETPNMGDMSKFRDWPEELFAQADVIVGGPPCQAFSVAGLRNGLNDERGNLTLTYAEMINHADAVRSLYGKPPVIVLYENVPGLLSDKTGAYGCFLAALAGESFPLEPAGGRWTDAGYVLGPKRAIAWRVLDAQYFQLAQRRRRVFVVASAREGFDPATVLFEWDGVRRDTPPSREAGEGSAGGFARSVALRGREGGGTAELGDEVQNCLRASSGGGDKPHVLAFGGNNTAGPIDVATARNACASASASGRMDFESETFLVQPVCVTGDITRTLKAEGFDASEDGAGRGQPIVVHGTQDPCVSEHTAFALGRNNGGENALAIAIQAGALRTNPNSGPDGVGVQLDHAYTLEARAEVQCVAVSDVVGAMSVAGATEKKHGFGWGQQDWENGYCQPTPTMQVRRLTPRECERLMGFPDDYTLIPWKAHQARAKRKGANAAGQSFEEWLIETTGRGLREPTTQDCPDGPRYRALGNSWAIPVVRWIGQRIDSVLSRGQTRPSHVEAAQKRSTPESGEQRRDRTGS